MRAVRRCASIRAAKPGGGTIATRDGCCQVGPCRGRTCTSEHSCRVRRHSVMSSSSASPLLPLQSTRHATPSFPHSRSLDKRHCTPSPVLYSLQIFYLLCTSMHYNSKPGEGPAQSTRPVCRSLLRCCRRRRLWLPTGKCSCCSATAATCTHHW